MSIDKDRLTGNLDETSNNSQTLPEFVFTAQEQKDNNHKFDSLNELQGKKNSK